MDYPITQPITWPIGMGLVLEEQRTNLLTYSQTFSLAAWGYPGTNFSLTGNYGVAPDGTMTAIRLLSTILWYLGTAVPITASNGYTISFYVKSNTGVNQSVRLYGCDTIVSSDLTVTTSWQRLSFTFTATSGTGHGIARNTAGDPNDILIWGAQLEIGAVPTSYIPTTSSPATRFVRSL